MAPDLLPEFSVVIPAKNEEDAIGKCLTALTELDPAGPPFEVILVDNGSQDRTKEIAETFKDRLALSVIDQIQGTIAGVRNAGAKRSRGRILAFLDADCLVRPDWLCRSHPFFRQPGVGVFGSQAYILPKNSRWAARAWYGGVERQERKEVVWLPSGNLLVAKEVFDTMGGFDETLVTTEDVEFCLRVRSSGLRNFSDGALAVEHLGTPQTPAEFYRKIKWHSSDGLRVFRRRWPDMAGGKAIFFAFSFLIAGMGLVGGAAIGYKSGQWLLFWISFVLLLLPSLLLSLRIAMQRGDWRLIAPLWLLHQLFGLARARTLLDRAAWKQIPSRSA